MRDAHAEKTGDGEPEQRRHFEFAAFRYDPAERTLVRDGTEVPLLPKASDLLLCLLERPGSIVSKDTLLEEVWDGSFVTDTALFQVVSSLRHAIGEDPRHPEIIETVHKRGYRLIAPVVKVPHRAGPRPPPGSEMTPEGRRSKFVVIGWTLLCLAVGALGAGLFLRGGGGPETDLAMRLEVPVVLPLPICSCNQPNLALSPDGRDLLYITHGPDHREQLYLLSLVDLSQSPTSLASGRPRSPFFSPGGDWVGYFQDRWLYKVSVRGGPPVRLSEVDSGRHGGASWGPDGVIVFSKGTGSGLWAVAEIGGIARRLTQPEESRGEHSHLWPEVLPGGKAVLFTVELKGGAEMGEGQLAVLSMETGQTTLVLEAGGSTPHFATSGHVMFGRRGALMSLEFDPETWVTRGSAILVLNDPRVGPKSTPSFALSRSGLLAYVPGSALDTDATLAWFKRDGTPLPGSLTPVDADFVAISADGDRLLVTRLGDIWVYDMARETFTRVTATRSRELAPVWSPDGTRVLFSSNRDGPFQFFSIGVNSSLAAIKLVATQADVFPGSWSPDGSALSISRSDPDTGWDLWMYFPDGDPPMQPFYGTPFMEASGKFSPDGEWIAYVGDEMGITEVYAQPYPSTGEKVQISHGGGSAPVWSPTGREIFFSREAEVWAVPFAVESRFQIGRAHRLFATGGLISALEISADGERLLVVMANEDPAADRVNLVLNWSSRSTLAEPSEP